MTDPSESPKPEALVLPGVLCVCPTGEGRSVVYLGPAAGWMAPRGIAGWAREVSFAARADVNAELGRALRATLPHEQIAPKKYRLAYRAVEASPFLPLTSKLVGDVQKAGVRVHTVGVDRVSAGFYYFGEGGAGEPVRVQCNLMEMLAPAVKAPGVDPAQLQEALIDRLLAMFSAGVVSELAVELAGALPRVSRDGTGLVDTDIEAFEVEARDLTMRSGRWGTAVRDLADRLAAANRSGKDSARVPLYGEALQEALPPLEVEIGGKVITLPAWRRWIVNGKPAQRPFAMSAPQPAAARSPVSLASPARPFTPPRPAKQPSEAEARTLEGAASITKEARGVAEIAATPPEGAAKAPAPEPGPAPKPEPAPVRKPEPTPEPAAAITSSPPPRRGAGRWVALAVVVALLALTGVVLLWPAEPSNDAADQAPEAPSSVARPTAAAPPVPSAPTLDEPANVAPANIIAPANIDESANVGTPAVADASANGDRETD